MKIKPSYYVLVAEIVTITLFHAVKIRQAERRPAEIEFTKADKLLPFHQPVTENKAVQDFVFGNLVK